MNLLEQGAPVGIVLTVVAGVVADLSPLTYPFVPVVVEYAAGGEKYTWRRALILSSAFALGIMTVYAVLGTIFSMLGWRC